MKNVAVAAVVTSSVLDEFLLLKYSFELFHGKGYQWFLRCDEVTAKILRDSDDISTNVFAHCIQNQIPNESPDFRPLVGEKMNAMDDAWACQKWEAVAFLDADLVITSCMFPMLESLPGEVILTPHHYSSASIMTESYYGRYNTGFVYSRNPLFPTWWREAYLSQPLKFADQACMNEVGDHFTIAELGPIANVGRWRYTENAEYEPIPAGCMFLHSHFYQPLRTTIDWYQRTFSVHCLKFLRDSDIRFHRVLYKEILKRDRVGWYSATLQLG